MPATPLTDEKADKKTDRKKTKKTKTKHCLIKKI